jgi:hypothetical protein
MAEDQAARRVLAAHKLITGAVKAGRISPERALNWARRAAAGENVSALAWADSCTGRGPRLVEGAGHRITR